MAGDFGVQEFRVAVVLVAELEITGHPLQRGGLLPEVPPVAEREPVRIGQLREFRIVVKALQNHRTDVRIKERLHLCAHTGKIIRPRRGFVVAPVRVFETDPACAVDIRVPGRKAAENAAERRIFVLPGANRRVFRQPFRHEVRETPFVIDRADVAARHFKFNLNLAVRNVKGDLFRKLRHSFEGTAGLEHTPAGIEVGRPEGITVIRQRKFLPAGQVQLQRGATPLVHIFFERRITEDFDRFEIGCD